MLPTLTQRCFSMRLYDFWITKLTDFDVIKSEIDIIFIIISKIYWYNRLISAFLESIPGHVSECKTGYYICAWQHIHFGNQSKKKKILVLMEDNTQFQIYSHHIQFAQYFWLLLWIRSICYTRMISLKNSYCKAFDVSLELLLINNIKH